MPVNHTKLIRRKFAKLFPIWYFIEYALLRITMMLINFFPITVSTWTARRIGDIMFLVLPDRRRTAFENLEIAFGNSKSESEKKRIVLESFRNLTTSVMEFFRLPKFLKACEKYIAFKGLEHIDRAFSKGKGMLLIISHLGPWEYLGFIPYLKKYPAAILGRPVRNPHIYRWIKSLREMMGLRYIDKDMGPKMVFSMLKKNQAVAVAIDQWAGNEGIWIDFFGKPTSTTTLPAELANRIGCALVPACCIRAASGKYEIHIESEVLLTGSEDDRVENATKELNCRLEKKIRAFPEQWVWTHKRWKNKRHVKVGSIT